jgi:hypothetical protein
LLAKCAELCRDADIETIGFAQWILAGLKNRRFTNP